MFSLLSTCCCVQKLEVSKKHLFIVFFSCYYKLSTTIVLQHVDPLFPVLNLTMGINLSTLIFDEVISFCPFIGVQVFSEQHGGFLSNTM